MEKKRVRGVVFISDGNPDTRNNAYEPGCLKMENKTIKVPLTRDFQKPVGEAIIEHDPIDPNIHIATAMVDESDLDLTWAIGGKLLRSHTDHGIRCVDEIELREVSLCAANVDKRIAPLHRLVRK